jgi:hypothetical protein
MALIFMALVLVARQLRQKMGFGRGSYQLGPGKESKMRGRWPGLGAARGTG